MLAGRKPGDALPSGLNPFDPAVTIEELFGNMSGAPLLDAILEFYGDGLVDVDGMQKTRTVVSFAAWSAHLSADAFRKGQSSAT